MPSTTPVLTVRKVDVDFADAQVLWNPKQPEYCQFWNALGTAVPYTEQFLVKLMREVRDLLPPDADPQLLLDIDTFNAQEGFHYRLHARFNQLMRDSGYTCVSAAETKAAADYERFRRRGVKFALAYCDGFETFGPFMASFFFDGAPDLMEDWHEPSTFLWLWHLAEEYEHRHVVNYALKELHPGYFYRIYGLWFASGHLFNHILRTAAKLIEQDRQAGRIGNKWVSRARYAKVLARIVAHLGPRIVAAHKPSYDPVQSKPPTNCLEMLADVAQRYNVRGAPVEIGA